MKVFRIIIVSFLAVIIAKQSIARECMDPNNLGPKKTLRIVYEINDRSKMKDVGKPLFEVQVPNVREVIYAGNNTWERTQGKVLVVDDEAKKSKTNRLKELEKKIDKITDAGGYSKELIDEYGRVLLLPMKYKPKLQEDIQVYTPKWRFQYDNVEKKGRKYITDIPEGAVETSAVMSIVEKIGLKQQVESKVKYKSNAGTRKIAGYTCTVTRVFSPATGEICEAVINGHEVVLYSDINIMHSLIDQIERAVKVEPGICVKPDLFDIPKDVNFNAY